MEYLDDIVASLEKKYLEKHTKKNISKFLFELYKIYPKYIYTEINLEKILNKNNITPSKIDVSYTEDGKSIFDFIEEKNNLKLLSKICLTQKGMLEIEKAINGEELRLLPYLYRFSVMINNKIKQNKISSNIILMEKKLMGKKIDISISDVLKVVTKSTDKNLMNLPYQDGNFQVLDLIINYTKDKDYNSNIVIDGKEIKNIILILMSLSISQDLFLKSEMNPEKLNLVKQIVRENPDMVSKIIQTNMTAIKGIFSDININRTKFSSLISSSLLFMELLIENNQLNDKALVSNVLETFSLILNESKLKEIRKTVSVSINDNEEYIKKIINYLKDLREYQLSSNLIENKKEEYVKVKI